MVGLKSKERKKAIFWGDVNGLTYKQVKTFITRIANRSEKLYPSDQIVDHRPDQEKGGN